MVGPVYTQTACAAHARTHTHEHVNAFRDVRCPLWSARLPSPAACSDWLVGTQFVGSLLVLLLCLLGDRLGRSDLRPNMERKGGRFTAEWGDIGFQGHDPATDFRWVHPSQHPADVGRTSVNQSIIPCLLSSRLALSLCTAGTWVFLV